MIAQVVIVGIVVAVLVGLVVHILARRSKNKWLAALGARFQLSNSVLLVFCLLLAVPIIWWMHSNRDVMSRGDQAGAFTTIIGLVVISLPFAFVFAVLAARVVAGGIISSILGQGGNVEPERYTKAKVLLARQEYQQAADEFRRLLVEKPDDDYCVEQLAEILDLRLHDYETAIGEYRKLAEMKIQPNRAANVLNRIADILDERLHDTQGAVESLNQIILKYPGTPAADKARSRIELLAKGDVSTGHGTRDQRK